MVVNKSIWQGIWNGSSFSFREILPQQTAAAYWLYENPVRACTSNSQCSRPYKDCGSGKCGFIQNFEAIPGPLLRTDGKQLIYSSTGGKYTYDDYLKNNNNIPWGNTGIFLANLAPAVANPADVDGSGTVNIKDIQACVKVITGSDMTYENKCRTLATPDTTTNIKDIQKIVQAIIGGN